MVRRYNKKNEITVHHETTKLMPSAVEVENAVLGSYLIDRDAFDTVSDELTEDSFYEEKNRTIFSVIKKMVQESRKVDVLTVTEELAKQGKLEEIGGPGYIAELSSKVASSAHIESHASILARKEHLRSLINITGVIYEKAYDESNDPEDLQQEAEQALYDLSQKGCTTTTVDLYTSLKDSIKEIEAASSHPDGITGVPSGFDKLDVMTAGFQPSDLVILAGRPAMGKTSFALNMAFNIASMGIPAAFFTLEMSHVQLTNRIISSVCEISGNRILRGNLNPEDWNKIDKRVNAMSTPLFIDDTPALSVFQIRSKARYLIQKKNVKIIFVDYLQLMSAGGEGYGTRQEEVSIVSRSLKALAKELNVPVVALSQLNRGIESREGIEGKRPRLSDLRESGSIEQDADMVLFVHRPEYYHIYQDENGRDLRGKAEIIIAKHRKGATGDIMLSFKAEYTRFEDPDLKPQTDLSKISKESSQMPFPPADDETMRF